MPSTTTAPELPAGHLAAQVGAGARTHYVPADGPQTTALCGRRITRLLADDEARTPCTRCADAAHQAPAAPAASGLMPDQARAIVATTHPDAHDFQPAHREDGTFLGYTFQVGTSRGRFGWITPSGTYAKGMEPYRSEAEALLPMAVLDDERRAQRPTPAEQRAAAHAARRDAEAARRDADPFKPGDRIVCADGTTRTVHAMAPAIAGEPARVIVDDGAQWIAANCDRAPAAPVETAPARPVLQGVIVQHDGTADGSAPKHATHPDVVAARAALAGIKAATLTDHHDTTEPTGEQQEVRGYVIEPRGAGRVAVYWLEGGQTIRHNHPAHGPSLDCLADRFARRGWTTEPMLRSSLCVFAHVPQDGQEPTAAATPADVTTPEGVTVRPDGRNKWTVNRGRDLVGVIWDEGPDMRRGRFALWCPFHPAARFFTDPAEAVAAAADAWPPSVADIAKETGAAPADVIAAADALAADTGMRVYRTAIRGAAAVVTDEAAASIRSTLAAPAADDGAEPVDVAPEPPAIQPRTPADACPQWRTLKGVTAPFYLYGTEREDGTFRLASDRRRCSGDPLLITRVWTDHSIRHAEDVNGREIFLWGTAGKYWVGIIP